MGPLEDRERQLLERLAAEGKATKLYVEDLPVAKSLVSAGLLVKTSCTPLSPPKDAACWQSLSESRQSPPNQPIGFMD